MSDQLLPPEEQAQRISQELDRYLLAASNLPCPISPEEEAELTLGRQLLETDFSHQSKIRSQLRRNLETEQGFRNSNPSRKLIKSATSRRQPTFLKRLFWPGLLTLVIVLTLWSWTSAASSDPLNASHLYPSPALLVTAVLPASQQPAGYDLRPLPTPLAPPGTVSHFSSSTVPVVQHTPFGLVYPIPETAKP